jgi:acyl carrier protein
MTLHVDEARELSIRDRVYDTLINNNYIDSKDSKEFYGDSLDSVDMIMNLEEEFNIDIPDSDIEKIAASATNFLDSSTRPPVIVDTIVNYLVSREDL